MKFIYVTFATAIVAMFSVIAQGKQIHSGTWQSIGYEVAGQWQIVAENDGLYVVLDDEFETKNGPDLYILLSPKRPTELTNSNTSTDALTIGLLETKDDSSFSKKMKGAQRLKIPDGTDLTQYSSIVIHCVKYSHVWAAGAID